MTKKTDRQKYILINSEGKPTEKVVYGYIALRKIIKKEFAPTKKEFWLYTINEKGEEIDLTESQFLDELMAEFIED